MTHNAINICYEKSCSGSMILDSTSAPRWKLSCNECKLVSCFSDTVNGNNCKIFISIDVEIIDQLCSECFGKFLKIHFRKNTGLGSIHGCVDCEENLHNLLETKISKSFRRGNRGGRGGRRRRGGRVNNASQGKPRSTTSLADYF